MDVKDKKIIVALENNSRASFSQLSKKVGLPAETIKYRFNKLRQEKIIENCITIINPVENNSFHAIYFKLQKATTQKKEEIINFLVNKKEISWVAELQGNYDLGIIIQSRKPTQLTKTLNEIYEFFGKEIMKRTLAINNQAEFLPREYLTKKTRSNLKKEYEPPKEITLDKIDKRILEELAVDSRKPAIQISKKLNIATDTVIKRIKKLEKNKIIQGYTITIDNKQLNQTHYKILISLRDFNNKTKNKLKELCRTNIKTIAIVETIAEWDLEVDIEIENNEEMQEFLNTILNELPNAIKDYEVLQVNKMRKFNFLP